MDDGSWRRESFGVAGSLLSKSDETQYSTHVEVARLFGKNYRGHQAATFKIDDFTQVWFPKLYSNGDWQNDLSPDGTLLTMRPEPGGKYGGVMEGKPLREYVITFAHIKPDTGSKHYKFLGVFELVPWLSDSTKWVHQLVSDSVYIDDAYLATFAPARTRPELDDQSAEAADIDPAQVATFQTQRCSHQGQ